MIPLFLPVQYLAWDGIPSLVAALTAFIAMYVYFRKYLANSVSATLTPLVIIHHLPPACAAAAEPPVLDPNSALIDKTGRASRSGFCSSPHLICTSLCVGAIFLTSLLVLNRILLSTAPLFGGAVWSISLATAGTMD